LRNAREALGGQLKNPDAMAIVRRAAAAALRKRCGAFEVSDLIADVVGDTYSGDLPFAPGANMTNHLIGELRRRADRSAREAKHLVSLDALEDELAPDVLDLDSGSALDARLTRFERSLPLLRERVSDDASVTRILALHEAGAHRDSAAFHDGLSKREYRNARRRLRDAARAIDSEIADSDAAYTADTAITPIGGKRLSRYRRTQRARARAAAVAAVPVDVRSKRTCK
jgi:hypothetical protein